MTPALDRIAGRRVIASVSGGKDSAALSLWLKEQGVDHDRVMMDTGWEHWLTYHYALRREQMPREAMKRLNGWTDGELDAALDSADAAYGGEAPLQQKIGAITVIRGARSMEELIEAKGMFPSRQIRFCTEELKVFPMRDHLAALMDSGLDVINAIGIRREESDSRRDAAEWEWEKTYDCDVWRPLVDHTMDDVIAIHARHGLRPNPLYLPPFNASRLGCWPCINAKKKEIRTIADSDPRRISHLRVLEQTVAISAEIRYQRDAAKWAEQPDPEPSMLDEAAHKRWTQKRDRLTSPFHAPAWFQAKLPDDAGGWPCWPIDKVVVWSRTSHGGRQIELFASNADSGCIRWGLCETHSNGGDA